MNMKISNIMFKNIFCQVFCIFKNIFNSIYHFSIYKSIYVSTSGNLMILRLCMYTPQNLREYVSRGFNKLKIINSLKSVANNFFYNTRCFLYMYRTKTPKKPTF